MGAGTLRCSSRLRVPTISALAGRPVGSQPLLLTSCGWEGSRPPGGRYQGHLVSRAQVTEGVPKTWGRSQGPPGRNQGMSQAGGPSRRGLTLRVLEAGTALAPPHPALRINTHHSACNSTLFRAPRVCPHRHRPDIGRGATGPAHPLLTGKGQNTAPPLGPLCFHNKGHPPAPVTGPACRLLPSPKPSEAHHTPTWKPSPRMSPCPSPSCADGPPGGHPLPCLTSLGLGWSSPTPPSVPPPLLPDSPLPQLDTIQESPGHGWLGAGV